MPTPLEIVRAALATTPREREYLDLGPTWSWPAADRAQAATEVLAAARAGDHRAPAALAGLIDREGRRQALDDLLAAPHGSVRTEAGYELLEILKVKVWEALESVIRQNQIERIGMKRAVSLVLATGGEWSIRPLVRDVKAEDLRTILIESLWEHFGFPMFPTVWWSGLGLVRRTLSIAMPSFRDPALDDFERLLDAGTPVALGYAPAAPGQDIPPPLEAAMRDIDNGSGPVPDALLAPLDDEQKRALLVYAADSALSGRMSARGVAYAGRLGGDKHRDLLEWAAAHRYAPLADAGKQALASLSATS